MATLDNSFMAIVAWSKAWFASGEVSVPLVKNNTICNRGSLISIVQQYSLGKFGTQDKFEKKNDK